MFSTEAGSAVNHEPQHRMNGSAVGQSLNGHSTSDNHISLTFLDFPGLYIFFKHRSNGKTCKLTFRSEACSLTNIMGICPNMLGALPWKQTVQNIKVMLLHDSETHYQEQNNTVMCVHAAKINPFTTTK